MSVDRHATPIDVALDRIAELVGTPRMGSVEDAVAALTCAALWREVYEGAMQREDAELAALAARERRHALDSYRAITREQSPPIP